MRRLAILGEIAAPAAADGRPWGLRRLDLETLGEVRERLAGRRVVVVTGPAETTAGGGDPAGTEAMPGDGDPAAEAMSGDGDVATAGSRTATDPAATMAVGLAAVAAAEGTRTVLVECDLARPRLAADLGLEPVPGLHEYLRWEATPEQVLQTLVPAGTAVGAGIAPLACVCAGRPGDSPRTLLGLGSFRHMTAKLRDAYELTVLLGPPLDGDDGSLELAAAEADATIAALPRHPDRRASKAAREALSGLAAPSLGAIVVTRAAG